MNPEYTNKSQYNQSSKTNFMQENKEKKIDCCDECIYIEDNSGGGIGGSTEYCENPNCSCHAAPIETKECSCNDDTCVEDGCLACVCNCHPVSEPKQTEEEATHKNFLSDVENLSSRFHQVYEAELVRQGKISKHKGFYHELPEDIKDLDRALAKYVIDFVIPNCIPTLLLTHNKELRDKIRKIKSEWNGVSDAEEVLQDVLDLLNEK